MDSLNEINGKRIVICGYGEYGEKLASYCRRNTSYKVVAVGDNDIKKHGTLPSGIPCISIEESAKISDARYIISVQKECLYNAIYMQLRSLGIEDVAISQIPKEITEFFIDEARKQKLTPRHLLKYEVNITKYCNLNCAYCNHYAPLSYSDDRMEIEDYIHDVRRLSQIFSGKASDILILGGEPLLHPDLLSFMKETRKNFHDANIKIVTNGILLNDMDEAFWGACRDWDVSLTVTYYPIKLDYDYLSQIAGYHNVKISIFKGHLSKISLTESEFLFNKYPLNLKGDNDKTASFMDCDLANGCITLDNGRLYTCSVIPNSYIFGRYFDVTLPRRENSGIDIYDESLSAEEVLRRLTIPVDFCRFCNVTQRCPEYWKSSNRDILEWI